MTMMVMLLMILIIKNNDEADDEADDASDDEDDGDDGDGDPVTSSDDDSNNPAPTTRDGRRRRRRRIRPWTTGMIPRTEGCRTLKPMAPRPRRMVCIRPSELVACYQAALNCLQLQHSGLCKSSDFIPVASTH